MLSLRLDRASISMRTVRLVSATVALLCALVLTSCGDQTYSEQDVRLAFGREGIALERFTVLEHELRGQLHSQGGLRGSLNRALGYTPALPRTVLVGWRNGKADELVILFSRPTTLRATVGASSQTISRVRRSGFRHLLRSNVIVLYQRRSPVRLRRLRQALDRLG
ncbi:MAG: hypothetical protein M3R70_12370 [Actinomycetota bacterium]|nr:hypothetical protein [Actinomycetota bacterium]